MAYKALRLARNEMQVVHHMATDATLALMPWVKQEQIRLSPDHPEIGCECEDVVTGGENGYGVYPKGEISLPIHVQCLCYKLGVQMDADRFVDRLRGWMRGTEPWAELDTYADWLGVTALEFTTVSLAVSLANGLVRWLWGGAEDLDDVMGEAL